MRVLFPVTVRQAVDRQVGTVWRLLHMCQPYLLRTPFDMLTTLLPPFLWTPSFFFLLAHVVTAVTDVSLRVTINTDQRGGDRLKLFISAADALSPHLKWVLIIFS